MKSDLDPRLNELLEIWSWPWLKYGAKNLTLTRSSFSGCGINSPRICVTMGPSVPPITTVCPSLMLPFTRITSIVVPRPAMAFTCNNNKSSETFLNSLAPGRCSCNLKLVIFISGRDILSISRKLPSRWTLVQVMAWCRQATSHYLNQCWPCFMMSYGVTRPQWVKRPHLNSGFKQKVVFSKG